MVPISALLSRVPAWFAHRWNTHQVDGSSLVCALGCESTARESGTREASYEVHALVCWHLSKIVGAYIYWNKGDGQWLLGEKLGITITGIGQSFEIS